MNIKEGCLFYILLIVIMWGISYLVTAGLIWLIMYGLTAIGIILPIAWSWSLSAVVWLILLLLKSTFKVTINK